jgi:hypothetical protein
MNLQFRYKFGLMLFTFALTAALPASAQEAYKGTFDLPVALHWGAAVLPPGHYTMSMEGASFGSRRMRIVGEGKTTLVPLPPSESTALSERGRLALVKVGGEYAMRELDAGVIGQSFTFAVPKAFRDKMRHGGTVAQTAISVSGGN